MGTLEFWNLSTVSDDRLLQDLSGLLSGSAHAEARVVAHLAEVEERRLHLKAAASSLFDYCVRRLGLSESEAFHRITAARLARKFSIIFKLLEARRIHLSGLRILRDHLTSENHRELLATASGKSKREIELLVATLAPRPDVPSGIRRLPAPRRRAFESRSTARADAALATNASGAAEPVPGSGTLASSPSQWVRPSLATCPPAPIEDVVASAATQTALAPQTALASKEAHVNRETYAPPRVHREHISNEVLRAVARRDGYECTYVDGEGRRCGSRAFLQVHHEQAHALGGRPTFENLRLLCGAHNRLLAERDFGRAHQELFTRRTPSEIPGRNAQALEGETVPEGTAAQ